MTEFELTIERVADTGQGIGTLPDGRLCFVRGALPGERVTAELTREKSRIVFADLVSVLELSPDRCVPECPAVPDCGGCNWQHCDQSAQSRLKRDLFESSVRHRLGPDAAGRIRPLVETTARLNYRSRVRLHLGEHGLGYMAHTSHRLVPIKGCPIAVPELDQLIRQWPDNLTTTLTAEGVTQLELRCDEENAISICITQVQGLEPGTIEGLLALPMVSGVATASEVFGDPVFRYDIDGLGLVAGPATFTQVNLDINRLLVKAVCEEVCQVPAARVFELFAGNGNFSIPLAAGGCDVVGCEASANAIADARTNGLANGMDSRTRFERRQIGAQVTPIPGDRNVLLLDPPRAGLKNLPAMVAGTSLDRIVYVSCDPATLIRDLAGCTNAGYQTTSLQIFDMFPQTSRIEVVAVLQPVGAQSKG